jgi:hypothetical protein
MVGTLLIPSVVLALFIAADLAPVAADRLLTRDRGFYRR